MSEKSVQVGPGLPTLLGVLFIGLKLTHYIDWPWVWVLAPLWVPLAILVGIMVIGGLFMLLAVMLENRR